MIDLSNVAEDIETACPRCGKDVVLRFYGPCEPCAKELRASQAGEKSDLEDVEYIPNMNVTPNAVASKE